MTSRPRGYKTFVVLNSAEHDICPANLSKLLKSVISFFFNIAENENLSTNKYENANHCWYFQSN